MSTLYYFEQAGQPIGPVPADQLVGQGVRATTLVWCTGMTGWVPAASLPALAGLFPPVPPPMPALPIGDVVAGSQPAQIEYPSAHRSAVPLVTSAEQFSARQPSPPAQPALPPRPTFTAPASTHPWWHYILYIVAVFMLLLVARACGVVLGKLVSANQQTGWHSAPIIACQPPVAPKASPFIRDSYL